MKINHRIILIAAFLAGLVLGVLVTGTAVWAVRPQVEVVEGEAWVNQEGTAVGLSPDGKTPGTSYVVAGALWREQAGAWQDTFPTCLEPLADAQSVRLGVMDVRPQGEVPGRQVVIWLECLP
jgi:hypothetical protein